MAVAALIAHERGGYPSLASVYVLLVVHGLAASIVDYGVSP
jgi:hypothetical protein